LLSRQETRREKILNAAGWLGTQFLYYARKQDEDLPVGEIEEAIFNDEITVEEIMDVVCEGFRVCFGDLGGKPARVPEAGSYPYPVRGYRSYRDEHSGGQDVRYRTSKQGWAVLPPAA
jgi:hypothetical protein